MKNLFWILFFVLPQLCFGQLKPNDLDTNNNPTARNVVTNIAAAEAQKATNNLNAVYDLLGSATAVTNTGYIVRSNNSGVLSFTSPQNTFVASNITTTRITSGGGTPTITTNLANSAAIVGFAGHVGDTVSISGNDMLHHIVYSVNGTGTTAATAVNSNSFAVITFSHAYPNPPKAVIPVIGLGVNVAARVFNWFGVGSTTNYTLSAGGNSMASPSTNSLDVLVIF